MGIRSTEFIQARSLANYLGCSIEKVQLIARKLGVEKADTSLLVGSHRRMIFYALDDAKRVLAEYYRREGELEAKRNDKIMREVLSGASGKRAIPPAMASRNRGGSQGRSSG